MYQVLQGHLLWLEVGMVTLSGCSFNTDERFLILKSIFSLNFLSSASRLLIISRVRHVICSDSPLILKPSFSFEFVLRRERRKRKKEQ